MHSCSWRPQLAEIAEAAARIQGGDTTAMFNDIVTCIARQSQMILDNLGIVVSVWEANQMYAESLGVAVDALTEEQQISAMLYAVREKSNVLLDMEAVTMKPEHHSQRVDLETGYIEATRDDTDEYQDLRVKAYTPDGTLIQESRIIYNVQYDYSRRQEWRNSVLIDDRVIPHHAYGHLQWEYSEGELSPDWINPYPDNYEHVKPEGADMFHKEGLNYGFISFELNVTADVHFYIWEDLEDWRKQGMNLITNVKHPEPHKQWIIDEWKQEEEERLKKPFDPARSRDMRLINLGKQCKEIGVDIPIDPRFID